MSGRSRQYGPPVENIVRSCVCARPSFDDGSCLYCGKPEAAPVVASPAALAARAVPALVLGERA